MKAMLMCDVIVYDLHDADLEELELVLNTFHASDITQEVTFILVSSVGCWARTPRSYENVPYPPSEPLGEAAPDGAEVAAALSDEASSPGSAPSRRPVALKSDEFGRRVAMPKFQEWKSIESLVLALKERSAIRPYVVGAGIPYGNGEEAFLSLFKAAWQSRESLRVIGTGGNYIPCVHVRDIARLVRRILEVMPALDYHLAVDRGDITQRALVEAVAGAFGIDYPIKSVSVPQAILAELADLLVLDLRLDPSELMDVDDGFKWFCETGVCANACMIAKEFTRWRQLMPVRFCIVGPPGCGSANVGALLAERYRIPSYDYKSLLDECRNTESPLGQQVRDIDAAIVAAASDAGKKKGKDPAPTTLPVALTVQVVRAALQKAPALNRGYVLSGYPSSAEEAAELFLEDPPQPPDQGPSGEKVWCESDALDVVVVLSSAEEECLRRLQESEDKPITDEEFQVKMNAWKKNNPDDGPGVAEFFREKSGREPLLTSVDGAAEYSEVVDKISAHVSEKRQVHNFVVPSHSKPRSRQAEEPADAAPPAKDEATVKREAEERRLKRDEDDRLEQIKREEWLRLERHSEQHRQYLMSFVVPAVSAGLVETCLVQPGDPVGYLAEFLCAYSQHKEARRRQAPGKRQISEGSRP